MPEGEERKGKGGRTRRKGRLDKNEGKKTLGAGGSRETL